MSDGKYLKKNIAALRERRDWLSRDGRLMSVKTANGFERREYAALHWAILHLTEKFPELADAGDVEFKMGRLPEEVKTRSGNPKLQEQGGGK